MEIHGALKTLDFVVIGVYVTTLIAIGMWVSFRRRGADDLRGRYEGLDEFVALRDELDPDGRFANGYLDRVLGPPPRR